MADDDGYPFGAAALLTVFVAIMWGTGAVNRGWSMAHYYASLGLWLSGMTFLALAIHLDEDTGDYDERMADKLLVAVLLVAMAFYPAGAVPGLDAAAVSKRVALTVVVSGGLFALLEAMRSSPNSTMKQGGAS